MTNDKNKRRGGFYWVGDAKDTPYLSVTKVLSIIDKPALRYWFGQQVYFAMVKDPSLDEKTALSAPYKVSDTAKNRGTTVHSIVEAYKNVGQFEVAPEYKGYADAFHKFMQTTHAQILDQEKTVLSAKHKYAGTLDMLASINGKNTLIDVKTGKDIYQEAFIQLSAYRNALEEGGTKIDDIAVVLLQPEGGYKFEYGVYDFEAFLACKKIFEAVNREMLTKIGYL